MAQGMGKLLRLFKYPFTDLELLHPRSGAYFLRTLLSLCTFPSSFALSFMVNTLPTSCIWQVPHVLGELVSGTHTVVFEALGAHGALLQLRPTFFLLFFPCHPPLVLFTVALM